MLTKLLPLLFSSINAKKFSLQEPKTHLIPIKTPRMTFSEHTFSRIFTEKLIQVCAEIQLKTLSGGQFCINTFACILDKYLKVYKYLSPHFIIIHKWNSQFEELFWIFLIIRNKILQTTNVTSVSRDWM